MTSVGCRRIAREPFTETGKNQQCDVVTRFVYVVDFCWFLSKEQVGEELEIKSTGRYRVQLECAEDWQSSCRQFDSVPGHFPPFKFSVYDRVNLLTA
jgi:hypothetical protein